MRCLRRELLVSRLAAAGWMLLGVSLFRGKHTCSSFTSSKVEQNMRVSLCVTCQTCKTCYTV